jgi:hypothetical protein
MNRLLLLLPAVALVGCDMSAPSTSAARPTVVAARTEPADPPRTEPTGQAPRTTKPADGPKADPKGAPFVRPEVEEPKEDPPEEAPPVPDEYKPLNEGKTIYFEKRADGTRRVHLMTAVCLREGPLEMLLCKKHSKEHESILHMDGDAREIHAALLIAGAQPGGPVEFNPYKAAHGTRIKVSLTYRMKGKVKTAAAGEWVTDLKAGKDMAYDWVFAGSKLWKDPDRQDAPPYYLANNGSFISLANFPESMLDLPVKSSKDTADLVFRANTARIPPVGSPVLVTLEPVLEKKK